MKKMFISLTLVALLSLASNACAEFYVIAGARGKPVGTEITSLPAYISSSGFFYITQNLTCLAGTHGITITADDVTLDLMGFSLIGPGGISTFAGIYIDGRSNVTIRNGSVMEFAGYGIVDDQTTAFGHSVINLKVKGSGATGIRLVGNAHRIEGCTTIKNGHHGIYAYKGATIINNRSYDNDKNGIMAAYGSIISNNTCVGNADTGIYAFSASTVTNNTCIENSGYGISGTRSLIDQNTTYLNTIGGILVNAGCVLGVNVDL